MLRTNFENQEYFSLAYRSVSCSAINYREAEVSLTSQHNKTYINNKISENNSHISLVECPILSSRNISRKVCLSDCVQDFKCFNRLNDTEREMFCIISPKTEDSIKDRTKSYD